MVNFAAESHNSRAVLDPAAFVRTNVLGTQMLLEAVRRAGGTRFHHISTCEVYGDLALDSAEDAARAAGAREVHVVEEPMAAAIGIDLPVHAPTGSMVIDIGGGTTDIGVIALGGLIVARNIRIAGDKFNTDIVSFVRSEHKMLIGEKTAEEIKIAAASVAPRRENLEAVVRGRDLVTGLPREIRVLDTDVRNAIGHAIEELAEAAKEVLEASPPEILSDIMQRGIYLCGGGALIRGLPQYLTAELGVSVVVAPDPLTTVVRGTAVILDDFASFRDALVRSDDELVPTE